MEMTTQTTDEPVRDYTYTDGVKYYQSPFNSQFGRFTVTAFEFPDGKEHIAVAKGQIDEADEPLVRIQSACLTGTAFLAHLCDCRQQLHLSLERVQEADAGLVIYLAQEGRGHGLVEKIAQLKLINSGMDTYDATVTRGHKTDPRSYEQAALILRILVGDRPIRLLTNNPKKLDGLRNAGVKVTEDVRLETTPTPTNYAYMRSKRDKMGHLMPSLIAP
jgi:3,4-dihydroxy 2-butanone 4-phosphate synthase/GTP cyclohydrolase II